MSNFLSVISNSKLEVLSVLALRVTLSLLMFSHGEGKLYSLIEEPEQPLNFIMRMTFFSDFPLISSWIVAVSEAIIIPVCILVGSFNFIGDLNKTISTFGGLISTILMLVIIFGFHIDVLEQGWADFKYQISLLAISIYFLFK
ncbi:MAG: hypothetical protein ACJ0F8_00725 [Gammaproteobacteria bacterium]|uniref:DoxX family protein n=1 Tax=SAR86 cluster bacterium TaxID=2030880 RepID=A0A520MXW5_9GAMM|nr:hypothetical protein [Gammaproteobacteria bacterium]MBA4730104.1 hypothetical protein [SAR86 cluster bacterium]MBH36909.1 hypothetical protein [Gammaproteobacteria bacterium]MBK86929.1 hypothetical protein [Flavobacteriaceae bacterium]RZO26016.1 MAG: hypothetical protein EVA92_03900 [SAR86 cluster bacterium]|tara:strand:- start:1274 stop:1702 length:429 start_codon:yes stop_codon:yes gene_type:complete